MLIRYRGAVTLLLALVSALLVPATAPAQIALNCSLYTQLDSLPGSGSSCWGYVDPITGSEYAILGNSNGTAIWNIDDPNNPDLTGFISGPNSAWREMKTYQDYCYVGTEGGGGLQIISLADPEAPFLAATYTGSGLSSIHTVTIDTLNAKLYANGANGGCRILSLANPTAPTQVGNYTTFYVHDSHVRDDTLYAACLSDGLRILDVSNPASIVQIAQFQTENDFVHNAWTTEDRQYLLVTDEVSGGRVTAWDISTITSPIQVDGFTADPSGDAHNVQILGDIAYVAHYTSGLQVLDVSDPTNMVRVGYYDTYLSPGGLFNGAWGVYNYFPSGVILISDIEGGLFLLDFIEDAGAVSGVIRNAGNAAPIAGATVSLSPGGAATTTNALGQYTLQAGAGDYTVNASAFGFSPNSAPVTIVEADTVTLDLNLTQLATGSMSGVFRYPQGAGIPNAIVRIKDTPLADTTDAGGAYSFPAIPEGSYTATLEYWTCLPESAEIDISTSLSPVEYNFGFEGVAFAFNFEDSSATGWGVNAQGGDDATTGQWTRVDPRPTGSGLVQPGDDHTRDPLAKCYVTGQGPAGGGIGDADVDNGHTTLTSPTINLTGLADPIVQYYRWYVNNAGGSPDEDVWKVQVSSNGGTTWVTTDSTRVTLAAWKEMKLRVADYVTPGSQFRMRFIAEDEGSGSVVEAAVDDFRIWSPSAVTDVDGPSRASAFALLPNAPNPFNPKTRIRFDLPATADVRLAVYSIEGRLVRTLVREPLGSGRHERVWDGRDERGTDVASGVYLLRLEAGKDAAARKIVLAK
jgi:choice-of-anchor B domain-containing protein